MIDWTPDIQAKLERFASYGFSASRVAREFGTTRNAILGRAHRTGVKFNGWVERAPKKEPAPRTEGEGRRGRRKGKYIKPRSLILQCLALHLAGVSQVKAAKMFGVSFRSIGLVWKKDPVLMAEASSIAVRALAEARASASARAAKLEAERRASEEADACWNELIFQALNARQVLMLRAYCKHGNMATAAAEVGVTRERIRQVVVRAERIGFIAPHAAKSDGRRGYVHPRSA